MLLAVDIGNSNIVFGVYIKNEWKFEWRLETSLEVDANYYAVFIRSNFLESNLKIDDLQGVVLSSVVLERTQVVFEALQTLQVKDTLLVNAKVYDSLRVHVTNPVEIGTDLVANAVAAFEKHQQNCLVIDFGTALTFTVVEAIDVTGIGRIKGVSIAPGIRTAMHALVDNTSKLPEIPLELPKSVIGKNTVHAIQSGILVGYVGLTEYMIAQIRKEVSSNLKVIATGGLSSVLKPLHKQFDEINPYLTLDGLRIIHDLCIE